MRYFFARALAANDQLTVTISVAMPRRAAPRRDGLLNTRDRRYRQDCVFNELYRTACIRDRVTFGDLRIVNLEILVPIFQLADEIETTQMPTKFDASRRVGE